MTNKEKYIDAPFEEVLNWIDPEYTLAGGICKLLQDCERCPANDYPVDMCKDRLSKWLEKECDKEPEPPEGEWLYGQDGFRRDGIFCSVCDHFVPWDHDYYDTIGHLTVQNQHCSMCGMKMKWKGGQI